MEHLLQINLRPLRGIPLEALFVTALIAPTKELPELPIFNSVVFYCLMNQLYHRLG